MLTKSFKIPQSCGWHITFSCHSKIPPAEDKTEDLTWILGDRSKWPNGQLLKAATRPPCIAYLAQATISGDSRRNLPVQNVPISLSRLNKGTTGSTYT